MTPPFAPPRNSSAPQQRIPLPTPEPVPDQATYLAEREKALAFSDARAENYRRYLAARRGEQLDYLPVKMDIENVSRCNFRCTMCTVSDWPKGRRANDLSLADFKRLIDEQYGVVEIKLQGIGEPLMQGDDFFEMIRYARGKCIWVRTTTNASLLHLRDNHRKLIDSGVNEVQISIDGADSETFESIRRGAVFPQVIENCKLINGYCRDQGIDRTKMWTVVQQANRHQLFQLVELAAETRFSNMVFGLNLTDWGLADWRRKNDAVTVEGNIAADIVERLIARGNELGVKVRFWTIAHKYDTRDPSTLCPWPFERAYYSSDGRVVPCCMIGNPEVYEVAEPGAANFSEIWKGSAYRAFRRAHIEGNPPPVCVNCYRRRTANGGGK